MTTIYCIEDINDLKYIGSTNRKLNTRLTEHKYSKNNNKKCSSSKLNLYNSIIYELEKCDKSKSKEREQYWINKIDCVNNYKLDFNQLDYNKERYYNDKSYQKNYYKNNKIKILKKYHEKKYIK